ncbi:uncharacterized protein LOC114359169 isoform X2 [Ostrinia furnacalis]|uniref:uncharacterized protein LOC114359169 isoform X2 n=1 Tax=Ostrinia furnacalis TaxID=93504 RepID=UPI001038C6E7|nr:uncharacterized protein LOC114359169 isoform X2 [Ostrinia furnacalis]
MTQNSFNLTSERTRKPRPQKTSDDANEVTQNSFNLTSERTRKHRPQKTSDDADEVTLANQNTSNLNSERPRARRTRKPRPQKTSDDANEVTQNSFNLTSERTRKPRPQKTSDDADEVTLANQNTSNLNSERPRARRTRKPRPQKTSDDANNQVTLANQNSSNLSERQKSKRGRKTKKTNSTTKQSSDTQCSKKNAKTNARKRKAKDKKKKSRSTKNTPKKQYKTRNTDNNKAKHKHTPHASGTCKGRHGAVTNRQRDVITEKQKESSENINTKYYAKILLTPGSKILTPFGSHSYVPINNMTSLLNKPKRPASDHCAAEIPQKIPRCDVSGKLTTHVTNTVSDALPKRIPFAPRNISLVKPTPINLSRSYCDASLNKQMFTSTVTSNPAPVKQMAFFTGNNCDKVNPTPKKIYAPATYDNASYQNSFDFLVSQPKVTYTSNSGCNNAVIPPSNVFTPAVNQLNYIPKPNAACTINSPPKSFTKLSPTRRDMNTQTEPVTHSQYGCDNTQTKGLSSSVDIEVPAPGNLLSIAVPTTQVSYAPKDGCVIINSKKQLSYAPRNPTIPKKNNWSSLSATSFNYRSRV